MSHLTPTPSPTVREPLQASRFSPSSGPFALPGTDLDAGTCGGCETPKGIWICIPAFHPGRLPAKTTTGNQPCGPREGRGLQENVLLWHSYFPRGHLDKPPPSRVQCAPWPEWTPLDASGSEQPLAHLDLSTFWSSTRFFPKHLHRLAHMSSGPTKVCGDVRRKLKRQGFCSPI